MLEILIINVQCATMKCEIIRKPMLLERVEVNLEKIPDYILSIFIFNDENPLYLIIISTVHSFEVIKE